MIYLFHILKFSKVHQRFNKLLQKKKNNAGMNNDVKLSKEVFVVGFLRHLWF